MRTIRLLIKHVALIINLCKVGSDGKTPVGRRKEKRFLRPLPEFREWLSYLKPMSLGNDVF